MSVCRLTLTSAVCRLVTDASVDVKKSQLASIRSGMAMFESSGKRGRAVWLVIQIYLLSIPSSSVTQKKRFPLLASYARKWDRATSQGTLYNRIAAAI